MSTILAALAILAGGAALAVAGWFARVLRKVHRRVTDFLDDWAGEPHRPGVPARPGVMARLERIEGELTVNGGTSVKDTVNQIRAEQSALRKGQ